MANYTTITQVKFELGTNQTTLLSDVDDTALAAIITKQSRIIDDYLQSVKTVPFDDVEATDSNLPKIVEELCIIFTKYKVWTRAAFKDIPESIQKEYSNAIKLIEKIQTGKVTIGPAETFTEPDTGGANSNLRWTSSAKIFTQDL